MRTLLLAVAIGLSFISTGVIAQSNKYPSNALQASLSVWPKGAVAEDATVTGRHSCGKRLRCKGGNTNTGKKGAALG